MSETQRDIGEFNFARGGAFNELQVQLGIMHENAETAGKRAAIFVAIAWGVPALLSLLIGRAFGTMDSHPFLLDASAATRFVVAIGLFALMERYVDQRLIVYLRQFARAPLLAPTSFEPAAEAVTRSLKRRDNVPAEIVCLIIAAIGSVFAAYNVLDSTFSSWAITVGADGGAMTPAGWWCVIVSSTMFWFLLLRWLWRHFVWAMLLREIAGLELRLTVNHPDGSGGLGFIGRYPNAFSAFILALSSVVGAAVARALLAGEVTLQVYGIIMGIWLVIVIALFAFPLQAFMRPLSELKERTILIASAQATKHHRAAERDILGTNMAASEDAEPTSAKDIPDPGKLIAAAKKLSTILVNREALVPIGAAALVPLVLAGSTQLPIKELFTILKRLLLL